MRWIRDHRTEPPASPISSRRDWSGGLSISVAAEGTGVERSKRQSERPRLWIRGSLQLIERLLLPALLTALALYLVPAPDRIAPADSGFEGLLRWVDEQSPAVTVAVFLLLASIFHHWQYSWPWAGWLLGKPGASSAQLAELERASEVAQQIRRTLQRPGGAEEQRAELRSALHALTAAWNAEDWASLREGIQQAQHRLADHGPWTGILAAVSRGAIPVLAVLLAVGARLFLFEMYRVPSSSMALTLHPGDRIGVNKLAYASAAGGTALPQRGDLIVFQHDLPGGTTNLVKRVVALPGDRVTLRDGHPVINGAEVPSCYVGKISYLDEQWRHFYVSVYLEALDGRLHIIIHTPYLRAFDHEYTVPPGEVFVLGDNRNNSMDSRSWRNGAGGGVALKDIVGRADWLLTTKLATQTINTLAFRDLRDLRDLPKQGGVDNSAEAAEIESGIEKCLQAGPPWSAGQISMKQGQF